MCRADLLRHEAAGVGRREVRGYALPGIAGVVGDPERPVVEPMARRSPLASSHNAPGSER